MKWLIGLLTSIILLSACSKQGDTPVPVGQEAKLLNVEYGPYPRNRMDVYLPANRKTDAPFVVLIHGGAWVAGNKEDFKGTQEWLLQLGIGSVSMNYRYVDANTHFTELMDDVHKAVSYCAGKAGAWQIRDTRYILCGASAGAHMALLYGYHYDTEKRAGGIISMVGPTDFTSPAMLNNAVTVGLAQAVGWLVGAAYAPGQPLDAKFSAASPVYQVTNVPSLLMYGTVDNLVLYSQAEILSTKLKQLSIPYKLVTFPNEGHDLGLSKPANLLLAQTEMLNWINQYGK